MVRRAMLTALLVAAGCATRKEYHALFSEGQTQRDMLTARGFEPDDSAYQALCQYTPEVGSGERTLLVRLPRSPDPESGRAYAQNTPGFRFTLDGLECSRFALDSAFGFSLVLTRWGGHGGLAAGTFSGRLVDSSSCPLHEVISIGGSFDAPIQ